MATEVSAIYKDRRAAQLTVDRLLESDFARDDISVLMSDATRGRKFSIEAQSKAPEGVAAGGSVGGALGAIVAGLVAVGVVAAPGLGLVAAGPILAALAGAGAGAAAGGTVGGLLGLGVVEHEAKLILDAIDAGGILVGVDAHDDRNDLAKKVFETCGGESIRS